MPAQQGGLSPRPGSSRATRAADQTLKPAAVATTVLGGPIPGSGSCGATRLGPGSSRALVPLLGRPTLATPADGPGARPWCRVQSPLAQGHPRYPAETGACVPGAGRGPPGLLPALPPCGSHLRVALHAGRGLLHGDGVMGPLVTKRWVWGCLQACLGGQRQCVSFPGRVALSPQAATGHGVLVLSGPHPGLLQVQAVSCRAEGTVGTSLHPAGRGLRRPRWAELCGRRGLHLGSAHQPRDWARGLTSLAEDVPPRRALLWAMGTALPRVWACAGTFSLPLFFPSLLLPCLSLG